MKCLNCGKIVKRGHGYTNQAYVQFLDGTSISGNDAIAIQEILKRNKGNSTKLEKLIFLAGSCKFKAQEIEEKERTNEYSISFGRN